MNCFFHPPKSVGEKLFRTKFPIYTNSIKIFPGSGQRNYFPFLATNKASGDTIFAIVNTRLQSTNYVLKSLFGTLKRNSAIPVCFFGKMEFLFGKLAQKPVFSVYFFGKMQVFFEWASSPLRVRFGSASTSVRDRFETGSRLVRYTFDRPSPPAEKHPNITRINPEADTCLVRHRYLLVPWKWGKINKKNRGSPGQLFSFS